MLAGRVAPRTHRGLDVSRASANFVIGGLRSEGSLDIERTDRKRGGTVHRAAPFLGVSCTVSRCLTDLDRSSLLHDDGDYLR